MASCLDEQPVRVDEGPRLGHDAHAGHPGEHAAEECGAAACGHVDESHLTVGGVAHLLGKAVEGREWHDDKLLRREEVNDEDERGSLERVESDDQLQLHKLCFCNARTLYQHGTPNVNDRLIDHMYVV